MAFTVTEDLAVVGLADCLAELGDADTDEAATRLQEYATPLAFPAATLTAR
jgi:hypothetical protein